ncbi:potassium voltage-gated channel subfamily E member 4 [Scyliorhinus torazame]
MDHLKATNFTEPHAGAAKAAGESGDNQYLYILIVMSFYGVFLLGIVLGYIKSKRHERKDDTPFLYDDRGEWAGLKAGNMPLVFSPLPESVVPALSCTMCTIENSVSSEAAQDIQLAAGEGVDGNENLLSDISDSSESSARLPTENPC